MHSDGRYYDNANDELMEGLNEHSEEPKNMPMTALYVKRAKEITSGMLYDGKDIPQQTVLSNCLVISLNSSLPALVLATGKRGVKKIDETHCN